MGTRQLAYSHSEWGEDLRLYETDHSGKRNLESISGRLEVIAQEVVLAKADAACEAIILLAMTRLVLGSRWKESDISCGRAEVQKAVAFSTIDFQQQAAHLLPGNLRINGLNSWTMVEKHLPGQEGFRLSAQLQMVFANTITLPACFNIADSKAEGGESGLKQAFAEAVIIMGRALGPKLKGITPFRLAVDAGLKHWFARVDEVYSRAAMDKRAKAESKDASKEKRERRMLEARVLAEYKRSCKIVQPLRLIDNNAGLRALMERQAELLPVTNP